MLGCSFTQKELQLSQLKPKKLPPNISFAKVTHDNRIQPVQNSVKHETVFPSQINDCCPVFADCKVMNSSFIFLAKNKTSLKKHRIIFL